MTLLAITAIGRAGAEVFVSELSRYDAIAMLPGQNFCSHEGILYRPRDYGGMTPDRVFDNLQAHCYQRESERAWAGLTKNMTTAARAAYAERDHRSAFLRRFAGNATTLDAIECFCRAYFEISGVTHGTARYLGFYTDNWALSLPAAEAAGHDVKILNITASPAVWTALISERLTWNADQALVFWICGTLAQMLYAAQLPGRIVSCSLDDYLVDPGEAIGGVIEKLGFDTGAKPGALPAGFPEIDRSRMAEIAALAHDQRKVLAGCIRFQLADSIASWGAAFVADPAGRTLIERYLRYWAGTSHIAFDVFGPVEQAIVDHAMTLIDLRDRTGLSYDFFYKRIEMHSRRFAAPVAHFDHAWGDLEDELVTPRAPYYIRAAIAYFDCVMEAQAYDPWTYRDIRQSSLYRRIAGAPFQDVIRLCGLASLWDKLQQRIDERAAHHRASHAFDRRFRLLGTRGNGDTGP